MLLKKQDTQKSFALSQTFQSQKRSLMWSPLGARLICSEVVLPSPFRPTEQTQVKAIEQGHGTPYPSTRGNGSVFFVWECGWPSSCCLAVFLLRGHDLMVCLFRHLFLSTTEGVATVQRKSGSELRTQRKLVAAVKCKRCPMFEIS